MKRWLKDLFSSIALWQPKPHYRDSFSKDGDPFSMIFYRRTGRVLFQRNNLGQFWSDKFMDLSQFFLKWAISSESAARAKRKENDKKGLR